MSVKCNLGIHDWDVDRCKSCGKERSKGDFTDTRDGRKYAWVKIGKQIWMAENLRFKTDGGCWTYENKDAMAGKYGFLYDWDTAMKAAPTGWHLPSEEEWKELINYLGGMKAAGRKMKTVHHYHGVQSDEHLTNMSGFSAVMGGDRDKAGEYIGLGVSGHWWSSTPYGGIGAWICTLWHDQPDAHMQQQTKMHGYSVRCVKDGGGIGG